MSEQAPATFGYREAQSWTIAIAVTGILLVETTVLHLWIAPTVPLAAWLVSASSVATLLWFWRDELRYRGGAIVVSASHIDLQLGGRWRSRVERRLVQSVHRPSWQDLPAAGTAAAADYVNVTKPADPNLLITLSDAVPVRAFGLVTKNVRRIGVHLDAPDEFVRRVQPD
jgi:hypothetical protein